MLTKHDLCGKINSVAEVITSDDGQALLAPLVEHLTLHQGVQGSRP